MVTNALLATIDLSADIELKVTPLTGHGAFSAANSALICRHTIVSALVVTQDVSLAPKRVRIADKLEAKFSQLRAMS